MGQATPSTEQPILLDTSSVGSRVSFSNNAKDAHVMFLTLFRCTSTQKNEGAALQ